MASMPAIPPESSRASPHGAAKFLDLFAGAGGFSLGLSAAGFECVGVVERDARCAETQALNFPEHLTAPLTRLGPERGDIARLDEREVRGALEGAGLREIDLVAGGPPCQGFSRVGRGKLDSLARQRGAFHRDPRNQLYRRYLDLLRWVRPRAFVFENVPGILRVRGENFAEQVCLDAEDAGYVVRCAVLNAAWYGVPQTRERVIIIGYRSDLGVVPSFPRPLFCPPSVTSGRGTSGLRTARFRRPEHFIEMRAESTLPPAITVRQALGDLPVLEAKGASASKFVARLPAAPVAYRVGRPSRFALAMREWTPMVGPDVVHDHVSRHTPRDYRIFAKMKPNECYPRAVHIAEELWKLSCLRGKVHERREFVPPYSVDGFEEKWKMLDPDLPSWTVTAHLSKDCYSHIHYDSEQARTITVREAARLQSFPDGFRFAGGMGDRFRQIGNAVPPLLALAVGEQVRAGLRAAASRADRATHTDDRAGRSTRGREADRVRWSRAVARVR